MDSSSSRQGSQRPVERNTGYDNSCEIYETQLKPLERLKPSSTWPSDQPSDGSKSDWAKDDPHRSTSGQMSQISHTESTPPGSSHLVHVLLNLNVQNFQHCPTIPTTGCSVQKSNLNELISLPPPQQMATTDPSSAPSALPILSNSIFAQIFERSLDAMSLSTLDDGRFIAVTDRFLQLSGYQRHELINHCSTDLNFWPKHDRDIHRERLQQHQSLHNQEGAIYTKDGTLKTVSVSAEMITVGGYPCVLCSLRDITPEKQTEEQLKLANERDRLLSTIALNIRQSLDLDQVLQSTVTKVRQFLEVERVFIARFDSNKMANIVAESVLDFLPSLAGAVIDQRVYEELSELFSHTPIRIINNVQTEIRESSCFKLLVERYQVKAGLAVPIMVKDELFGVLVAHQCTDPRPWTEFEQQLLKQLRTQVEIAIQQSELYQQVQTLNANLEKKVAVRTQELADRTYQLEKRTQELEQLGQFRDFLLHAVTHDIHTTVVGMLMLFQGLDRQGDNQDPVCIPRRYFKRMMQASILQRDKLDAIREVHSLEIQGLSLNSHPLTPQAIVHEGVVEDLQAYALQNQAVIINQVSSSLPLVVGDIVQLKRVIQHLVTNAIAHNPPGVTITLHANVQSEDTVQLRPSPIAPTLSDQAQHYVTFYVTDDGQGIAPEKGDRLFQLCGKTSHPPQLGGIRLGLYLCRQIITAHQGTIDVDRYVDKTIKKGTTVAFTLPCAY